MVFKMDNSQSSYIFSQSSVNLGNASIIDTESYHLLLAKIKASAFENGNENNNRLSEHFNIILNDCKSCIFQGFDIILSLLDNLNVPIDRICSYINDAACILQILSNYIKNVIETIAITCCKMKTFPINTGNIIYLVFSHCKDSECIYGSYLYDVEKQLKVLFRNCHELQLTYLLALGKNFLFDLSEKEEQDILIEALDINLKIGEVVQSLDVKTMAEQWKAYTMICEKYSKFLLDKNVYNDCSKLLVSTIEHNVKTALEAAEDKVVIRSLKVSSFSLKILLRMSTIFRGAMCINYQCVLDLLTNMSLCNCNYYELTLNKSPQFTNLLSTNLIVPVDALISQLISEETFLKLAISTNINNTHEPKFLANILLRVSIMKAVLKKKDIFCDIKNKLIDDVLSILPKCHVWLNMGIKFKLIANNREKEFCGLYDHLLVHTVALAASMTCEEFNKLEKRLCDAIISFDYYTAMFSSNVWVSLCRISNSQLQTNTLQNLLKMYQQLENHRSFDNSPQQVNLSYTIEIFYRTLKYPEKLLIYKNFNLQDNKNIGVWCALKIRNLPENLELSAERLVTEKLITILNKSEYCDIECLIKWIKLASTCSFVECNPKLEDLIVKSWSKVCPNCNGTIHNNPTVYKYIESLTYLTDCYVENFENSASVNKILHVMSSIMIKGNRDLIILLFKTFCKLLCPTEDEDITEINLLINVLKAVQTDCDIHSSLFNVISINNEINDLVTPVLNSDKSLKELRYNFGEFKTKFQDPIERKQQLEIVCEHEFKHKCVENDGSGLKLENVKNGGNFDLDIDSLFEVESEPASKKAKFDTNLENLLSNLENDVSLLAQAKENIFSDHKNRIKKICDNLKNIIT